MRMRYVLTAVLAIGAFGVPIYAQEPGGLNKVARNISKTMKKAGRDTKAEVRRDAGKTHRALTKGGNDTKAELKRTTGVTSRTPDAEHKAGGLNKVARDVSHAGKQAGAKAKHGIKKTSSRAHGELTKAGKGAKETVKKP